MAKKIFIIDDQRDLVEALKERFEQDGFEIMTAFDGEGCVQRIKDEHPDLITLDVEMPKVDGFTVVRGIKAEDSIKHIPIIVLTGKDQMEDLFRMEGVQDYIVKPFEYDALRRLVQKLLDESD